MQAPHRTSQTHLRETARIGLGPSQRSGLKKIWSPKYPSRPRLTRRPHLQSPHKATPTGLPIDPAHMLHPRPCTQTPPKAPPASPPPPRPLPSGTAAVFGHPPVVSACFQSLPAFYASPVGADQVRSAPVPRTLYNHPCVNQETQHPCELYPVLPGDPYMGAFADCEPGL